MTTDEEVIPMIDRTLREKRQQKALERLLFVGAALLIILGAVNLTGCNGDPPPPPNTGFDCDDIQGSAEILKAEEPTGGYIVTFNEGVDEVGAASALSAVPAGLAAAARESGYYAASNQMFVADIDVAAARSILASADVLFVQEVGAKRAIPLPDPLAVASWGLDRSDQRHLPLDGQYGVVGGAGVQLYIVDTGVHLAHPDFAGRTGGCWGYWGGCSDGHGHGTHVAGSAAGTDYGIAKLATVNAVKVLLDNGSGTDASVIAGINWAAEHCEAGGFDNCIGNLSLGGGNSDALDTALCRTRDVMSWVVAAGNSSADACQGSPNRVKQALTVGATTSSDARAYFSNYGPCLDVFAPGYNIKSARPPSGEDTMSGTSMAAPHVAGVAALCAEADLDPFDCVISNSTPDKVTDAGAGSPNRLLYAVVN
jgi:subtilisin family serine protease